MTETTARLVFAAIMALGGVVWLWSLLLALRIGRDEEAGDRWRDGGAEGHPRVGVRRGEHTLTGDPERLSRALVRSLLQGHGGMFGGRFEVVERTARRVVVRKTGPLVVNQPAGLYFSEAVFDLEPRGGDRVRVGWALGFARLARRLRRIALGLIFGVGLPVMLVVGGLIWFLVLPTDNDAVRWQVVQTVHIGHALWPPFLLIFLYSRGRREAPTYVVNLLTALEHED